MKPVKVRELNIGEGIPKICVPIVGKTKSEIIEMAKRICKTTGDDGKPAADLIEWRVDWFEHVFEENAVKDVLTKLREILGEIPLLFTFRTKHEGGEREASEEEYLRLNLVAIESGKIDLADVEIFSMKAVAGEIISKANAKGVKTVGSNHDFEKTPAREEIVRRLAYMEETGADIAKIAVMPKLERDVITLLEATKEAASEKCNNPIITMSMAKLGEISRVEGEKYGSAVTFGALGEASAPGQIEARELRRMLLKAHREVRK